MYPDKLKLTNATHIADDDKEPGRYLVKASRDCEWEILKWDGGGWVMEFDGFDKDCGIYEAYVCYGPLS